MPLGLDKTQLFCYASYMTGQGKRKNYDGPTFGAGVVPTSKALAGLEAHNAGALPFMGRAGENKMTNKTKPQRTMGTEQRITMDKSPVVGSSSPWGTIQYVTVRVPDHVVAVSTAGHGGLWVSKEWRDKMPKALLIPSTFYKAGSPWFEEDVECLRVMAANPALFPTISPDEIRKALSSYYPECLQEVS